MANKEQVAILRKGAAKWNKWRADFPEITPDLSDTDLVDANLARADFSGVDLTDADLSGANLTNAGLSGANLINTNLARADLTSADLTSADLSIANLTGAILSHASLDGADLIGANLRIANLNGAILTQADLTGVVFGSTSLGDADLSEALGLEMAIHESPSFVGIDTIYKSKGKIPESFLRDAGVPESFITQMHSLVNAEDGIQFYSCFISYSSKDEEFAKRLHGKMRDAHLRVWFAPEDIQGGKKLHEQIETAIRVYDKLLVVLSEHSLQSEWVMTELRRARKAERQSGKRKLFPVRLVDFATLRDWECFDADGGKDLAVELREYFIPDFSQWKEHDPFEAAFARLLKDLKAEAHAA